MKVILLETMGHLGAVGDVVDVKPGYARNYLLPSGKASAASARNVDLVAHQKLIVEHKIARLRTASEELKKKLEKDGLKIKRKAGENDKLFGSVTAMDIEETLRNAGVIVSRRGIVLDEPIKKAGSYTVPVKLDGGIEAKVSLEVIAVVA